jgi:hypothetical protein
MASLFDHWRQHYADNDRNSSVDEVFRAFRAAQLLLQRAPNLRKLVTMTEPGQDLRNVQANIEWLVRQANGTNTACGASTLEGKEVGAGRAAKRRKTGA